MWIGRPGRGPDVALLWLTLLPRGKRLHLCQRSRSGRWKAPFSVFASDFRGREKPAGLKGLAEGKAAQSPRSHRGGLPAHPVAVPSWSGGCARKDAGVPEDSWGSSHTCSRPPPTAGWGSELGHLAVTHPLRGACIRGTHCPGQMTALVRCAHTGRARGGLPSSRL